MTNVTPNPRAGSIGCATTGAQAVAPPQPIGDLFEALYADLCRLARREVRRVGAAGMVGTETLVHEAWLDVEGRRSLVFTEPRQFLAYASRTMRGLVIDRVRAQHAQKRGGDLDITALDTHHAEEVAQPELLEGIGDALDELAALDPDLATVVDLKFFGGLSTAEIAALQEVSERTVQRQWDKARVYLHRSLRGESPLDN